MDNIEVLIKRNRLMSRILWFISVLFITFSSISGVDRKSLFIIGPVLIVLSISVSFLVIRGIAKANMMYIIAAALAVIHFLFVSIFHDLNGFFIGFLIMTLITLYQYYKVTLLTSLLALFNITYGYFTGGEKMFGTFYDPLGLTIIVFVFSMLALIMCAQGRSTEAIRRDVEIKRDDAEKSANSLKDLFEQISRVINTLITFSSNLESNVNSTAAISKELTGAFNEISVNIESEVSVLSKITKAVNEEATNMIAVSEQSNMMKTLSEQTLSLAKSGQNNIDYLSEEMQKVDTNISCTVKSMEDLNAQAENIESILTSVNSISEQINLLSLNAAIEAARAGEHGRGFSVVAEEIRKLAEQSKQSNQQIEIILENIKSKIENIYTQINFVQASAKTSISSVSEVSILFKDINSNSNTVVDKASEVNIMSQNTDKASHEILNQVTEITSFAEETSASVEEVLASSTEQTGKIADIVESFKTLEDLIAKLKNIIN